MKADGGIRAGSMGAAFRLWGRRTAAAHGTEGTDAGAAMKGSARTGTNKKNRLHSRADGSLRYSLVTIVHPLVKLTKTMFC